MVTCAAGTPGRYFTYYYSMACDRMLPKALAMVTIFIAIFSPALVLGIKRPTTVKGLP